jgi:hypothetical protein
VESLVNSVLDLGFHNAVKLSSGISGSAQLHTVGFS